MKERYRWAGRVADVGFDLRSERTARQHRRANLDEKDTYTKNKTNQKTRKWPEPALLHRRRRGRRQGHRTGPYINAARQQLRFIAAPDVRLIFADRAKHTRPPSALRRQAVRHARFLSSSFHPDKKKKKTKIQWTGSQSGASREASTPHVRFLRLMFLFSIIWRIGSLYSCLLAAFVYPRGLLKIPARAANQPRTLDLRSKKSSCLHRDAVYSFMKSKDLQHDFSKFP